MTNNDGTHRMVEAQTEFAALLREFIRLQTSIVDGFIPAVAVLDTASRSALGAALDGELSAAHAGLLNLAETVHRYAAAISA